MGRQWAGKHKAFTTLRVIIWPEARAGLFNPASHGSEQKWFPLRSLRLCGE
jgi:hypothetical protein